MTTEKTLSRPLPRAAAERERIARLGRARFPLVLKIFILTALLIAIVVAAAIGVTLRRADQIATETVNKSISGAAALFADLQETRLRELALGANSIGRDPNVAAYVQEAQGPAPAATGAAAPSGVTAPQAAPETAPGADTASILDQLGERQEVLKSDLLIATNSDGIVLARTDQTNPAGGGKPEDLYETQPLVRAAIESPNGETTTGVMVLGDRLYHAAVAPINVGAGAVRVGFVVNAYRIDERFANQIAKSTKAEVAFIPTIKRKQADAPVPRSTDAPGLESFNSMGEVDTLLSGAKSLPPHRVHLPGGQYVMTGQALTSGSKPIGAAVFLRSLDRELAPFRAIQQTLLGAGAIALIAAFVLSWIVAKRLTRPIERLAGYAQSVSEGDYDVQPETNRSDEIGILSHAFAQMISALRDKAELEELYAEMAARIEEKEQQQAPTVTGAALAAPISEEATIMVTDLRGIAVDGSDADAIIDRVARAMRMQEHEVKRQDGIVRQIIGHRLVCTFSGDRAVLHATRAARAIAEEFSSHKEGELSVGVGIAAGQFVSGGVALDHESGLALVGNAPLVALLFAWEAPTSVAFVSLESSQQLSADLMANATREEVRLRWLPAPVTAFAVPLQSLPGGTTMRTTSGLSMTAQAPTLRMDDAGAPISRPAMSPTQELRPGAMFANRYAIEQVIGRGGMGVVYRATDKELDETVAIKTLQGDALMRSTEELERFKREIRLARKITHRNVLRTYDYGEANGVYFISMEYVRGYTLAELLEESPKMALRPAMGLARQICRGLDAAHDEGVIHRDIKPQNVLVDQKGQVKLMDFGIARRAEAAEGMTAAGIIVGTPHYMSPEQVQGKNLDARSDVYSMGVMMYEMLTGQKPFDSEALMGVLTAHLTEKPRPAIELRPEIGAEINRIIMRCLEKDPGKRFANAAELLDALDRLQPLTAAA